MKKIIAILLITLIASMALNFTFIKRFNAEKENNKFDSSISIMVYDESVGNYVNSNEIPVGMYLLNEEKTNCVGRGVISNYNSETGTIKYDLEASDECYVYFDPASSLANYIKYLYTGDGVNGLYYHDGTGTYANATLEAGDNSYRYSGTNPNNFVCFGDDCENYDNLYRIIGVFGDKVKLIKADYANSNLLGTNGDYNSTTYSASSYANYKTRGKLSTINTYYWNNSNGTSSTNDWAKSRLNVINLNKNFVNNLDRLYVNMIEDSEWVVSGGALPKLRESGAKIAYDYEIAENCQTCDNTKVIRTTYNAKIGLMYVSDYYYAATPNNWTLVGYNLSSSIKDYQAAINENWLYLGVHEWTISRNSSYNNVGFFIFYTGAVGDNYVYNGDYDAVRPVFFLKSNIKYVKGSGTANDPMHISL